MIALIKEAWRLSREYKVAEREKAELTSIAKVFNDRYTYRKEYVTILSRFEGYPNCLRGYAWMCPECNTIHHPSTCDGVSGLIYPACHHTGAGSRLYSDIRTS